MTLRLFDGCCSEGAEQQRRATTTQSNNNKRAITTKHSAKSACALRTLAWVGGGGPDQKRPLLETSGLKRFRSPARELQAPPLTVAGSVLFFFKSTFLINVVVVSLLRFSSPGQSASILDRRALSRLQSRSKPCARWQS